MGTDTIYLDRDHRAELLAHTREIEALTGYYRPNGTALAAISRHRDSCVLDVCNFDAALSMLRAADPRTDVARFGHWGYGWIDQIRIPLSAAAIDAHRSIVAALADYPVLDDQAFAAAEYADLLDTLTACYGVETDHADAVASYLFDVCSVGYAEDLRAADVAEALADLGLVDPDED